MRKLLALMCVSSLLPSGLSAEDQPVGAGIAEMFKIVAGGPAAQEKRKYVEQVFAHNDCQMNVATLETYLTNDGYEIGLGHLKHPMELDFEKNLVVPTDVAILNLSITAMLQDGALEFAGQSPQSIKSNGKGCA